MKFQFILMIILLSTLTSKGQILQPVLSDRPNGITIESFCYDRDTCFKSIFVGISEKAYFNCKNKDKLKRTDISNEKDLTEELNTLLTFDFIKELNDCTTKKGAGDTVCGYFLMKKVDAITSDIILDIDFANPSLCGSNNFNRILEILQIITLKY